MNVNKEKVTERKMYVGVGTVKVLTFSPTREKLNKLLEYTPQEGKEQEEIEYCDSNKEFKRKDSEGNELESIFCKQVRIDAWVEEIKTKSKNKIQFYVYDTPSISKEGVPCWINQVGQTLYCDTKENLPSWFSHFPLKDKGGDSSQGGGEERIIRQALVGEKEFYQFLNTWLSSSPETQWMNTKSTTDIFLDNKKLFAGKFGELNELLDNFGENTILVPFTVKSYQDKEGNDKEIQNIPNRYFCQSNQMNLFRNSEREEFDNLKKNYEYIKEKNKSKINKAIYNISSFYGQIVDTEHGIKDFFIMTDLKEYTPDMNALNSGTAVVGKQVTASDSKY